MRIIFYNYYLPYKNFFQDVQGTQIETFDNFSEFKAQWIKDEECIIIIPVQVFDLVGLDIRFVFREYGRDDSKRFLLIGDRKQIEFSLTQNDTFNRNIIEEVQLPMPYELIETAIIKKINKIATLKKG